MNRLLTGRLATYHFSPTPLSRNNLIKESVDDRNIIITGNTVIDALYWVVDKIKNNKELDNELEDILSLSLIHISYTPLTPKNTMTK